MESGGTVAKLENRLKQYLVGVMGTRWDVQSHEDRLSVGIPDLSYGINQVNGWIELKQVPKWPVKAETLVKPSKYTPNQVSWIKKRNKKGGHCFVIVRVNRKEYFLFRADIARELRKGLSRADYFCHSIAHWTDHVNPDELKQLLSASIYIPTSER